MKVPPEEHEEYGIILTAFEVAGTAVIIFIAIGIAIAGLNWLAGAWIIR